MIYLVSYILVGLLITNIDKHDNKTNKVILILAISILTLLSAFRDETIGCDVKGYALGSFKAANHVTNFNELLLYMNSGLEWGYRLLVLICSKLFHSLNGVLFGTSLIINSCVIIGLYRIRKHISINFAALSYCFIFYQDTLNMMRQWIAMAIIIYGFIYIIERKFFRYIFIIAIATTFHVTAIIGLLLYIVAEIVRKDNGYKKQILIVVLTIFCVINLGEIVEILSHNGWIDRKYMYYVTGNDISISFQMTIVRVPIIALGMLLYKAMFEKDKYHKTWFLYLIIDLILSQLHSVMDFAQRLGAYFTVAQMFELSLAVKVGEQKQRNLVGYLVILYLLMYWYVYYIYFNFGNTYPYVSIL